MLKIGVLNECTDSEKRVSLVPGDVKKLCDRNVQVVIQSGAGSGSLHSDSEYRDAGAEVTGSEQTVFDSSDIIVMLQRPDDHQVSMIRENTVLIGSIYPYRFAELLKKIAERGATAFSMELLPRITRAQSMDILSSQSSVAGYRAAVIGAFWSPRLMPMLTTAAGTVRPAAVLVIGAGVAGLMAIATARRLGATVTAYDVRKSAGEDVRSLGAKFLEFTIDAVGEGGYARELTEDERGKEREILEEAILQSDLIITTAGVPGKKAPVIISGHVVRNLKQGTVIVDIAAESGGNCELTKPGEIVQEGSIKIIGPVNPPSEVPVNASQMYSRNMLSFLSVLVDDAGKLVDPDADEILNACLLCRNGEIMDFQNTGGKR